jgi:hypothetical protein
MQKKGPALLIVALIVILVFILGVRYGQRVEKTNKNIEALLTLGPTKPQPTQSAVGYETYDGTACGAQFLYPDDLRVENESSQSANITGGDQRITFSCGATNPFLALLEGQKVASDELTLLNRVVPVQLAGADVYFTLTNNLTGRQVYFVVTKALIPLFNTSLEFVLPPTPTLAPTSAN